MGEVTVQEMFKEIADKISEDSKSWMRQFECDAPAEMERRRKNAGGIKGIVRTVLSLFIKPRLGDDETIYIFEGLRNKEYMKVFSPASVMIVGSHLEKEYARFHGYKFRWSFPIVGATQSKMYRGWNFPIVQQIKYWIDALSKSKRVVFFLYEDTQPLGVFFVHLGRMLKSKVASVCIQHGIFYEMQYPIRPDGELSDINFVWDHDQVAVIRCNRSKAFEIGLPYVATATPTTELIAVLVGTGMPYFNSDYYENSLNVFSVIYEALIHVGLKVFYRPHPNEWAHEHIISELREIFPLLDESDKVPRLNGPRAIFIGTISSLLYEAGVAGHFVAHLRIYDEVTSGVDCDFSFGPEDINDLVEWVTSIRASPCGETPRQDSGKFGPLERFVHALHSAKLIDDNDVKMY